MEKSRANSLSPTALAFIGDAAHALYIRKRLVAATTAVGGTLHLKATEFVNAAAQALCYDELINKGVFTEEEEDIGRRARNAHAHSHTKAADSAQYHRATALEAVIGFLELTGDFSRRDELLDKCYGIIASKKEKQKE